MDFPKFNETWMERNSRGCKEAKQSKRRGKKIICIKLEIGENVLERGRIRVMGTFMDTSASGEGGVGLEGK